LVNEGERFGAELEKFKLSEFTRREPEFAPSSEVLANGEGLAGASVVSVETGAGGSCFASAVPRSSLSGDEDSFSTISALSEEDFSESGSRSGSEIGHNTEFRISIEK
jgi:hypothetical protein